jgi:carboxymethylenebutenolidase
MTEGEWGKAFGYYQGFDMDKGVADAGAALGEAANISGPHMMHIAELDQFVPPEAQTVIKDGLVGNAKVTIHSYANVDHAFARTGGEHFDAASATQANTRTAEFFAQHLA